ncbi:MAG: hypothetical protein QOH04_3180 [Sphingomonadales bacterium]|jgi:hypothetical protein|nr:hypothetical protein [Sphingomonadales bacterium]MEA3037378.1 hypothetical protein [Sphingomonadales bacterium]
MRKYEKVSGRGAPAAAAASRSWQAPKVRRLVASSAENSSHNNTDFTENLS